MQGTSSAAQGTLSVGVNDTPATFFYSATVHVSVETLSDTLTLSSWHENALQTNLVDNAGGDHWTSSAGTNRSFTTALAVYAWVTNDGSINADVFAAAKNATTETVTYTFAWDDPTPGDGQAALVSDELIFYTETTSSNASAYASSASAETTAVETKTIQFAVSGLGIGEANKVKVGYIHARIEGDPANTTRDADFVHDKTKTYVGGIEGTGTAFNQ